MLSTVFRKDPASRKRMADKVAGSTSALRAEAKAKSKAMWENYLAAAYEHACPELFVRPRIHLDVQLPTEVRSRTGGSSMPTYSCSPR